MTRKDFEAIANIATNARLDAVNRNSTDGIEAVYGMALDMSDYFATDNPRFDRAKFLAACGF